MEREAAKQRTLMRMYGMKSFPWLTTHSFLFLSNINTSPFLISPMYRQGGSETKDSHEDMWDEIVSMIHNTSISLSWYEFEGFVFFYFEFHQCFQVVYPPNFDFIFKYSLALLSMILKCYWYRNSSSFLHFLLCIPNHF